MEQAVDWILNFGPVLTFPAAIILFGIILKQGVKKSVRAGVMIGIGFVGIGLVISLLMNTLGPALQSMASNLGLQLNVVDVGWPIAASITFSTPVAPLLIPLVIILNVVLVLTNITRTLNIDLWNFWHLIFSASIVYYAFDNLFLALFVGLLVATIVLKLADWTAPVVEHHFGLQGGALPHTETINFAPITYALNRIEDKIPGLNKLNVNADTLSQRLGFFGEPLVMGFLIGGAVALLGGYDFKGTVILGVQMAAVLILIPRMVAFIMEGLIPVSDGIRELVQKKLSGKKIYIGLDASVVIGNPANMAVALLMVPITLLLAVILPFNRVLPFADLAVLPFTVIWAVAASRGNIVRGIINSTAIIIIVLFITTNFAPLITTMGQAAGFDIPVGNTQISSLDAGSHVLTWMIVRLLDPGNPMFLLAVVAAVMYILVWIWVRNDIRKQYAKELEAQSGE